MDSLICFSDAASVSSAPAMARISVADHAGKPEDPDPADRFGDHRPLRLIST